MNSLPFHFSYVDVNDLMVFIYHVYENLNNECASPRPPKKRKEKTKEKTKQNKSKKKKNPTSIHVVYMLLAYTDTVLS